MADVEGRGGGSGRGQLGVGGGTGLGWAGGTTLSLLSWDDPITPKAPLQLQILQLLPQLLALLLLLLLPETEPEDR